SDAAMVDLLLKSGADPNATFGEGETALMTAARTGNLAIVKALLAAGAKVNVSETWRGQTPLMWAAAEGHVQVVEALIAAGAEINARSKASFTPFLFAVREGRMDVAKKLIAAGVSPNETLTASGRRGNTSALVLAVSNAHFELASMLLDAGADPNANINGWTALHIISDVRKPGAGSNDPAPDGSGSMDSLEMVRRLVAKGANINGRTTKTKNVGLTSLNTAGATPFLLAARTDDAELMRLLVKLGADPLIPTNDGSTPLMVAAGVGTRSPGEDAGLEPEALEAVKLAVELGGDVNAVDKNGETAMHGTAYKWMPTVAQFLVDHGAKPQIWNQKNSHGWTALRIADGVHRGMNLRRSPETAVVLRKSLQAAGLSTEVEPETGISGSTK
ncbi:MAG TPA: ankyrin repeat domain-containing protein, partial [Bryobacteraceae bacterium]|nr:ankyrin repeat domain-containing protein [Bryobacteraceae bacterium]